MYRCILPTPAYVACKALLQGRSGYAYLVKEVIKHVSALRIIIISLFLTITNCIFCQAPNVAWKKSLGGSIQDNATSIQQTTDGGYIVVGWSSSNDGDVSGNHGGNDCWIVKIDALGNIQWQKCLGGSKADEPYAVRQTTDGGYIVAGRTYSNDGDVSGNHSLYDDFWIVKMDALGNIRWQKSLGGSGSEEARSIQQTGDGGYIVAGWSSSNDGDVTGNHSITTYDYWIVKMDALGNIQWQKCLGGSGLDKAFGVQQTNDDGYIIAGLSSSNDGNISGHHGNVEIADCWIVKLDASGNIQWQNSLGGTNTDEGYAVQQTTDGGYIVAGRSFSNDGNVTGHHGSNNESDYWIVKLNAVGNIQWQKSLGGASGDLAFSIQQTTDGGYIAAGGSASDDGDASGNHSTGIFVDYWIVKMDALGNIQWQKCLGGSELDRAHAIQQTTDGGYIVAGYSHSNDGDVSDHHGLTAFEDYWIVKFLCSTAVMPGVITGNISPCQGSTVTYSIAVVNGATNYTWSIPVGWIIVSGQGTTSISVIAGNTVGTIAVSANFACGASAPQTLAIIPAPVVIPQVTISSVAGTAICIGTNATFTAMAVNGGTAPVYQWKVNGTNVGTNASTFNSSTFANGDIITCELTNNDGCTNPATAISSGISMTVMPGVPPSVNIISTATTICPDKNVTFIATALNAGLSPTYQWRLNGINAATGPVYTFKKLPGSYMIDCIVTPGSNSCSSTNVTSNSIPVIVYPLPVITVHPADTIVKPRTHVQLNTLINGNIQSFEWSPVSELMNGSTLSPVTVPLTNTTDYRLNVVSEHGCQASTKVSIRVFKKLFMPNAFSPNNDGLNDVFRIPSDVLFTLKSFSIYNRWGEKIFSTTDIGKGWDGTVNGVKQPSGIYVYFLNGSDDQGAVFMKDSFMLIR